MNVFEYNKEQREKYGKTHLHLLDELICSKCGRRAYVNDAWDDNWDMPFIDNDGKEYKAVCSYCKL